MTRLVKPASCYCYPRPNHHVDACVRYKRLYCISMGSTRKKDEKEQSHSQSPNKTRYKLNFPVTFVCYVLLSPPVGQWVNRMPLVCVLLCVLFVLRQVAAGQNGHTHPLVDHEARNAHHGSSALVELDAAFIRLPRVRLLVPAKVEGAVPVVAGKFALAGPVAIHDLHEQRGEHELHQHVETALNIIVVQGRKGLEAGWDGLGAGKTQTGGRRQVPRHGEHRDPAVLDLLLTKPGKVVGVLLQNKHGVPKTELL
jgi:hypothetical protein